MLLNVSRRHDTTPRFTSPVAQLHFPTLGKRNVLDPLYLSFSIDISVLLGGLWWENSRRIKKGLGTVRVPALGLQDERLDRYTRALAPFTLRIGGSEADNVSYFSTGESLVMQRADWDALQHFVQRHQLKLYFTAKYTKAGPWSSQELETLLAYNREQGYRIHTIELGNEVNAYWLFYGLKSQPKASTLARDYSHFSNRVKHYDSRTQVAGPGSAFWPRLAEPLTPFSNLTQAFLQHMREPLDVVDWHYYPFQSMRSPLRTRCATLRNMLNVHAMRDFEVYGRRIQQWCEEYQPQAVVWLGESGSAQCGGQAGLSDRWASCFWWADQLGRGAELGHGRMIRQSLIGGDYALLDRVSLRPRPDYWLSLLWKHCMGGEVLSCINDTETLRSYCHRNPRGEQWLLLINFAEQDVHITLPSGLRATAVFELHAHTAHSENVLINGRDADTLDEPSEIFTLLEKKSPTQCRARSIQFWRLEAPVAMQ